MPRFLAIDGDSSRIHVLSGAVKGGTVRLEKAIAYDDGQPLTLATAEAAGRNLREQLKAGGVAPAPLLVCVGRDRVVFKDVKIPPVAAHEEPALVRFQAMKELADADEMFLDYVPSSGKGPDRRVQVAALKKDILGAYRKMAEAAGLKLTAVVPRPFAVAAGLRRAIATQQVPAPDEGHAVALLVRGDKWGEFVVSRDGVVLQTRTIAGPALASEAALAGELRRNLAIHANQMPDAPVKLVYLAEADTPGGLRERLQTTLSLPVHAYDPLVGIAPPDGPVGSPAGLAGLLALEAASADLPINFIQPRQPRPPRDPGKKLLAIVAAVGLLVLVVGGAGGVLQLSKKSREASALEREKEDLETIVKSAEPDLKRLKALDEWSATEINWLDELYDMTARVPDITKMRITQLTATPLEDRTGKSKHTATLVVKGVTTDDHVPLDKLMAEANKEPAYRVHPKQLKPNTQIERRFVQEFTSRIEVSKRPLDKYKSSFTAKPPEKKTRPRGGDGGLGFPLGGFGP